MKKATWKLYLVGYCDSTGLRLSLSFAFSSKLPGDAVAASTWTPCYVTVADDTRCHSLPWMEASAQDGSGGTATLLAPCLPLCEHLSPPRVTLVLKDKYCSYVVPKLSPSINLELT